MYLTQNTQNNLKNYTQNYTQNNLKKFHTLAQLTIIILKI